MRSFMTLSVFVFGSLMAHAQTGSNEVQRLDQAIAKAQKTLAVEVQGELIRYESSLERLEDWYRSKGNLDGLLVVRAERQRIDKTPALSVKHLVAAPSELLKLQTSSLEIIGAKEKKFSDFEQRVSLQRRGLIEAQIKELVRAGKIDEAKIVRAKLEGRNIPPSVPSGVPLPPEPGVAGQPLPLLTNPGQAPAPKPLANEVVPRGAIYRYHVANSPGPAGWFTAAFDDSAWRQGKSGFGFADGDDNTIVDMRYKFRCVFARTTFTTDKPQSIDLHILYDDGFVAYLNGKEVVRENVAKRSWGFSVKTHEADAEEHFPLGILPPGTHQFAIVAYNRNNESSDLTLSPRLLATPVKP